MAVMIETRNLTYTYPAPEGETNPPALRDVSVQIEKGSFTVVLGHNGSGKSTFAKHLNAVLLPCGGAVYVDGMDTRDEKLLLEIRRRTGMVFQNPDNQIVANVVEEDVAFGPENLGIASPEIRRRVDSALKQVDMYEYRTHAPHLLSGGQKQRIAIAGVIAMEPKCIVLDEPTAMLDPRGRREVIDTIGRLNREKGITVVLITHDNSIAVKAKRIVRLQDGRIIYDGDASDPAAVVQPEEMKVISSQVTYLECILSMLNHRDGRLKLKMLSLLKQEDIHLYHLLSRVLEYILR